MLFGFEFSNIIKNNRLGMLSQDNFDIQPAENILPLEPDEEKHLSQPIFIRGNNSERQKIDSIYTNTKRGISSKQLVTIKNCALIGCDLIKNIESGKFTSLIGLTNSEQIIKRHLSAFSGYQFYNSPDDANKKIFYKNGINIKPKGKGLILHGLEGKNYGSFLFRILPQILLAKELELTFDYFIVPERTSWLLQAIGVMDFGVKPILTNQEVQGVPLDECIYIQSNDNRGFLSSFDRLRLISFANKLKYGTKDITYSKKIYISRRLDSHKTNSRHFESENDVVSHLEKLGFEEVFPEIHCLKSQINIFANSELIIGPSGSGLLNSMFAESGSKVFELEAKSVCTNQHASIYSSTNKKYAFYFGDIKNDSNAKSSPLRWSVPLDDFFMSVNDFIYS